MWIAFLVVVCLVALAALALPFFQPADSWELPDRDAELERLLAEKSRTLRTLKDLDHEIQSGLLDGESHGRLRGEYLERAVVLNREIASLTGVDPSRMADSAGGAAS